MSADIGSRVREVRGKMSQREFADLLGISNANVSHIEQGKAMPGSEFLLKIKSTLDVDLNWLLTGVSKSGESPSMTHIMNQREQALLDNYRNCEPDAKDTIEKVALFASKPAQELIIKIKKA